MSFIGTAFAIGDAAAALAASVGTGIASLGATGGALAGTAAGEIGRAHV